MAGRPRKKYSVDQSAQHKKHPRPRVDISTVPQSERAALEHYAECIQKLIAEESTNNGEISESSIAQVALELDKSPYLVVDAIYRFKVYHSIYKGEAPANAFTPLVSGKTKPVKPKQSSTNTEKVSSDQAPNIAVQVKRRPDISTISELKRSRIIDYANRIHEVLRAKIKNGGIVPDGERRAAATELDVDITTIDKHVERLRKYLAAYPKEPLANAFTPLPRGRPKGRTVPSDVQEAIEKATINTKWPSLNHDGTTSEIIEPLRPALIHNLMIKAFSNYSHSHWTTRRVMNDYRAEHMAEVEVLHGNDDLLQKVLPWIKNKVPGCGVRVQVDIRDLPWVVDYNGIHCTVRTVIFVEDYSSFAPVWFLLPAKRMDNDGEVIGVNYTCQQVRELAAVLILRMEKRFRIIYADNGSQFMESALGPYMPLLVAPDEDPSVLINRGVGRPRGGGHVENILGQLNRFLGGRPGHIKEKMYRKSYKNLRIVTPPKFEDAVKDCDAFMNSWNHDRVDGNPSCYDKWMSGPDLSLSMPPLANLTVFARTHRMETRQADPRGFNVDGKLYKPFRDDPEIYKALGNAKAAHKDIPVIITELAEYKMIYFSLDGGETYELAVEEGKKDTTRATQVKLLDAVDQAIQKTGNEAAIFIKMLLQSTESPLVLNGLRKQPSFHEHDGSPFSVDDSDPTRSQGPEFAMPSDPLQPPSPTPTTTNQTKKSGKASKKGRRGQTSTPRKATSTERPSRGASGQHSSQQPSAQASNTDNSSVPETLFDLDDTDEFWKELRNELGEDDAE